jgi:hypothetical protein
MLQLKYFILFTFSLLLIPSVKSQMITGVWHGRINRQKVEVKIIQKGDSLVGTAYYFESFNNYRQYSIKGYFDAQTNEAVWWDDFLLDEKSPKFSIGNPGKIPLLSHADFNCPGGGKMMLDGKAAKKEEDDNPIGEIHLSKAANPYFEDDWDFIIDNYTVGGNDPEIIDSIGFIVNNNTNTPPASDVVQPVAAMVNKDNPEQNLPTTPIAKKENAIAIIEKLPVIEEKFTQRKKVFIKEIPIAGDSIELRFYDNAEIDGDSISLFLNNELLKANIRLAAKPFIIKLALTDLQSSNELVMVAENLGTIPPNTSYMVAMVNEIKYDAYLASSEGSSAMIKLIKQ